MDFMQLKPTYDYYDHGLYNTSNHMDRRGFGIMNNIYKEKDVGMKPFKSNLRKNCNNYFTKPSPTPNIEDILNENVVYNDKLDFDFEEHILPPCFDTLINAENQILASPDLNLLKLASPDLDSLITEQETDNDRMNNNEDMLKEIPQRNEIFQPINQFNQRNDQNLIGSNAPEEMNIRDVPEVSRNDNILTTSMSEKEIQLIKEVNKALECILPIKKEDSEEENILDNELNFDNDIFEPLQQVPCLEDIHVSTRINKDYHKGINNDYHRSFTNEYHKDLTDGYNNDLCIDYHKDLYIKTEPSSLENDFILETDDSPSPSFYDMIEAQVRHQKQKREHEVKVSRKILDRYLPAEQDLIKRYIEGDKGHLPIPPINLEIQEIIKRERKKHKNRVAASKCRKKKLEREAQLEVRVNYLKERSVELNSVVRDLRNQATSLKQRIMEHISAGCSLNPNVLPTGMNPYYA